LLQNNYQKGYLMINRNLTERECEILQYVSDSLTNVEIGLKIGLSHKTVQNHLTNIMFKLNVKNRTSAIREGFRKGYIDLNIPVCEKRNI